MTTHPSTVGEITVSTYRSFAAIAPPSEIVSSISVPVKQGQLLGDRWTKDNVSSLDSARARKFPVLASAQRISRISSSDSTRVRKFPVLTAYNE